MNTRKQKGENIVKEELSALGQVLSEGGPYAGLLGVAIFIIHCYVNRQREMRGLYRDVIKMFEKHVDSVEQLEKTVQDLTELIQKNREEEK